jgi:hypothetical protein
MPQPNMSLRVAPAGRMAYCSRRERIAAAVSDGVCASNSAAIPETYGADADVP